MPAFLIDARFLLHHVTESFWGAPLIVVDGHDHTFCFGFLRDLLRLRGALHVRAGAVVIASDASSVAAEKDIRSVVTLCGELGVIISEEPGISALAAVAAHANRFSDIVTDDRRMLQFCSETRAVHLVKDPRSIERMTAVDVQRNLGVPVEQVPTYLALSEGPKRGVARSTPSQPVLTARDARRLVELHGSLPGIYRHLSALRAPALRKKLLEHQKTFEQRYRENTVCPPESPAQLPRSLTWKLDGKRCEALLRRCGFYSLIRMLPLTEKSSKAVGVPNDAVSARSYRAVRNRADFKEMLARVGRSRVCAIDTEADDNDPRTATLLGISFAWAPGEAFFVPFHERDMSDLTPGVVRSGLQKLFQERAEFVGHNLKYDLALLRRHSVEPPTTCFDTLLAVHDCYGDLDLLNLPFLAQKLLGRKIKAYKDIVPKGQTFLELPFEEMKEHACCDADIALQLYTFLKRELQNRMIERQFEEHTLPLLRVLLDTERDGVPADRCRLEQLRSRLVDNMRDLKKRVSDSAGGEVDLDSPREILNVMRNKLGLQELLGNRSLTPMMLEQLAPQRPALRWVIEYKRYGKQVARLEAIIQAIRGGRVYPVFSQTRDDAGRVSSTDPDLFKDDGLVGLQECIGGEPAKWFRDATRSLDRLQRASGDLLLKEDREGPGRDNLFMKSQASMQGIDHNELLLRVAVGESSHRLSNRFLVDRLAINDIVHKLSTRYSSAFRYLSESISEASKRGYVEREGLRRHFDGFGSSSIEKRNAAKVLARRWLLDY